MITILEECIDSADNSWEIVSVFDLKSSAILTIINSFNGDDYQIDYHNIQDKYLTIYYSVKKNGKYYRAFRIKTFYVVHKDWVLINN